jgi:tetratricopeptide (TPR) repeat protein
VILNAPHDSIKFIALRWVYSLHEELNRDSAIYFAEEALRLAQKNGKKLAEGYVRVNIGYQLTHKGKYGEALPYFLEGFKIARNPSNSSTEWQLEPSGAEQNRLILLAYTHHMLAVLMARAQNIDQELFHFLEARRIAAEAGHDKRIMLADMNLGNTYFKMGKIDSAFYYEEEALQRANRTGYRKYLSGIYFFLGKLHQAKGDLSPATGYYYAAIQSAFDQQNMVVVGRAYNELSSYHKGRGALDSALYYAHRNREVLQLVGSTQPENNLGVVFESLFNIFQRKGNADSAVRYASLGFRISDSIYRERLQSLSELQQLSFRSSPGLKSCKAKGN